MVNTQCFRILQMLYMDKAVFGFPPQDIKIQIVEAFCATAMFAYHNSIAKLCFSLSFCNGRESWLLFVLLTSCPKQMEITL